METALLLIDIQNDYFPGGKMELGGSVEASRKAAGILSLFRKNKMPVFHVQHISMRKGASFFLPDTHGAEIHESVAPLQDEMVIQKNYPNSFRETMLLPLLRKAGISHLLVCGMMTHMCVDASVRAAFDHGFECSVIHDACASKDLSFNGKNVKAEDVHASFLAALGSVYAKLIGSTEFAANIEQHLHG